MSCVHDGGFGTAIACPKCNAELASLLDAPPCGAVVGVREDGVTMLCNKGAGHYGEHSHTWWGMLHCDRPGWSGTFTLAPDKEEE